MGRTNIRKQRFQRPRGTEDLLPEEQRYRRFFESRAVEVAERFGYDRIETPMFEDARLFERGIGEVTDIVEKETYTFQDRGGDLLTLRPEGTAPVCRAYLEHGLHNRPQPVRMYYMGPFFRYERPQAGRYRQLHQFGIEVIGDADASIDAEVIELAWRLLESLAISEVKLLLNSIGDPECRPGYVAELQSYYRSQVVQHDDCKRRLETNPLRLLDCKQDSCQPLIAGAPKSLDYLCASCSEHWDSLIGHLGATGIGYEIDNRLVRGFDYYTRTVFEFVPPEAGSQSTLMAGGRYDGLIEELGGRPAPGIGFGMGIERVLANLERQGTAIPEAHAVKVVVAHIGEESLEESIKLASNLRREGVATVLGPSGRGLKSQLRYASANGASHALILGPDEIERSIVVVRDLARSEQTEVSPERLVEHLTSDGE